jgi:hypothetical protein
MDCSSSAECDEGRAAKLKMSMAAAERRGEMVAKEGRKGDMSRSALDVRAFAALHLVDVFGGSSRRPRR